jgi:hypothetical protein
LCRSNISETFFTLGFVASTAFYVPVLKVNPQSRVPIFFFFFHQIGNFCEKKERPMSAREKRQKAEEEAAQKRKEKKRADAAARREKCNTNAPPIPSQKKHVLGRISHSR